LMGISRDTDAWGCEQMRKVRGGACSPGGSIGRSSEVHSESYK
jgi:hypothetical protein